MVAVVQFIRLLLDGFCQADKVFLYPEAAHLVLSVLFSCSEGILEKKRTNRPEEYFVCV